MKTGRVQNSLQIRSQGMKAGEANSVFRETTVNTTFSLTGTSELNNKRKKELDGPVKLQRSM